MQSAMFLNHSNEAFIGMWNSEPTVFGPLGSSNDRMYMEDWKAKHFAKHLANRELLKLGEETHTSPKDKDGVIDDVVFMNMFNKGYIVGEEEGSASEIATAVINKNVKAKVEEKEEEFADLNTPKKVAKE